MSVNIKHVEELRHIDLVARVEIARKVGKILAKQNGSADKADALELAQILMEDVAVSVREALSRELQVCSFLPKDLVSKLAQDIDQVSMPFLMASQAMDDALLEDIVRSCSEGAQEAIAQRIGLPEAVSYAISDVGCKSAVESLVGNDTIELSERSCNRVVDRFPEERSLMESWPSAQTCQPPLWNGSFSRFPSGTVSIFRKSLALLQIMRLTWRLWPTGRCFRGRLRWRR